MGGGNYSQYAPEKSYINVQVNPAPISSTIVKRVVLFTNQGKQLVLEQFDQMFRKKIAKYFQEMTIYADAPVTK